MGTNNPAKDYWTTIEACMENPADRLDIRVIALLGVIPTIACACLGSPIGRNLFYEHGLTAADAKTFSLAYAFLAALAFFSHALLYLWVIFKQKETLFCICVSLLLFYLASSLCLAIVISAIAVNYDYVYFGLTNLILWLFYSSVLMFFIMVVYSQGFALERISSENLTFPSFPTFRSK